MMPGRDVRVGSSGKKAFVRRRGLANGAVAFLALGGALGLSELVVRQFHPSLRSWCNERPRMLQRSSNPDLVWEPLPGAMVEDSRHHVSYRINPQGTRGPQVALPKPGDVFRLLAVGDSFTFGYEEVEEGTLPHLLADVLNQREGRGRRFEVVNGGVNGYNTYQELAWLRDRGLGFEPDLVLVNFYSNDLYSGVWPGDIWCLDAPVRLPTGFFPDPRVDVLPSPAPLPWSKEWIKEQIRLYDLASVRWDQLLTSLGHRRAPPEPDAPPIPVSNPPLADYESGAWLWYRRLMYEMRDLLAAYDVPLVVWVAVSPAEVTTTRSAQVEANFRRFSSESGIPILFPWPLLHDRDLSPLYLGGGHLSAEGNGLLATALARLLASRGLL